MTPCDPTVTPEDVKAMLIPRTDRYGAWLRMTREARGRTLGDVARALDTSVVYLSEIERGQRAPISNVADCVVLGAVLSLPASIFVDAARRLYPSAADLSR